VSYGTTSDYLKGATVPRRRSIAGLVGVAAVSIALLRGLTRRFEIKESSMAPTLEPGDWVLARRRIATPERGDVIVFREPSEAGLNLVKRTIGLPGEDVAITEGRVTINGAVLADPWAHGSTSIDGSWYIPEGHVWVLGDNRGASASDGRTIGPTPIEGIDWQLVSRYWPANRIGLVT